MVEKNLVSIGRVGNPSLLGECTSGKGTGMLVFNSSKEQDLNGLLTIFQTGVVSVSQS